jgi:hypothetical protein
LFFGAGGSWSNVRIATFESKFVWIRFVNSISLKAKANSLTQGCKETEKQREQNGLKRFVFWREGLEAGIGFCDCIPLLNKNSLWIRFGFSENLDLFTISFIWNFEAEARKNKKSQRFVIRTQKRAKIC